MGDDHFLQRILQREERSGTIPSVDRIMEFVSQQYGLDEKVLKAPDQRRVASQARALIGWLALEFGSATLTEIGKRFNRDVGTLSSAGQRLVDRAQKSPELRNHMECLRSEIGMISDMPMEFRYGYTDDNC